MLDRRHFHLIAGALDLEQSLVGTAEARRLGPRRLTAVEVRGIEASQLTVLGQRTLDRLEVDRSLRNRGENGPDVHRSRELVLRVSFNEVRVPCGFHRVRIAL